VIEAKFLFEFLIVALDAPAQFGRLHERRDGCTLRQGREPVFGRRVFALGPFDEQPFDGDENVRDPPLLMACGSDVPMSGSCATSRGSSISSYVGD
jgi:hypothetical protein